MYFWFCHFNDKCCNNYNFLSRCFLLLSGFSRSYQKQSHEDRLKSKAISTYCFIEIKKKNLFDF